MPGSHGATLIVGTLSRQLQAISAGGWANIQTPVREGFEAVEVTTNGLAEQLSASREDVRRLEARLVGMEEMLSRRVDSSARSAKEEVSALQTTLDGVPRHADVQTIASEACRELELAVTEKSLALERALAEVHEESRKAAESMRQAVARKAELSDLEAFCPRGEAATRADLLDLEGRVGKKADKDTMATSLSTKVSWPDFERLLREKADESALTELNATCATAAALERVELGLARTVGMEEVRAFVESQTGDIQAMSPALVRLLAARAKEESETAERGPASSVTRAELPGLVQSSLLELREGGGDGLSPRAHAAQVQAAISAGRESTLRTVGSQLAHARGAQQEELLTQEKRFRLELEESVGRVRGRVDGLGKGLEQTKGELVSLLNSKAYKADVSLALQGKADSKGLESVTALVRSKANESDHREIASRTLHTIAALSAEIAGLRTEMRTDVERLSGRLLTKADSDDLLAFKSSWNAVAPQPQQPQPLSSSSTTLPDPEARARRPHSGGGGTPCIATPGWAQARIEGAIPPQQQPPMSVAVPQSELNGSSCPGGRKAVINGGAADRSLTREETRLLIRAELKRAGVSDKITREEASAQAEACASRALSIASNALGAMNLRLRAISERMETPATVIGEPNAQRVFDAQSCLELRLARFLSLGRWLWRGQNPNSGRFPEKSGAVAAAAEAVAVAMGRAETGVRGCGSARPSAAGGLNGYSGGIRVPWEAETANASPAFLKWKPGGTGVTAVAPGLYLVSCGFFCHLPFAATVYLNGHPVYTFSSEQSPADDDDADDGATFVAPRAAGSLSSSERRPQPRSQERAVAHQPSPPPPNPRPAPATVLVGDHSSNSENAGGSKNASGGEGVPGGAVGVSPKGSSTSAAAASTGEAAEEPGHARAMSGVTQSSLRHVNITASPSGPSMSAPAPETRRRRWRHPAGAVLASSVREYLACPAGGELSVEFRVMMDRSRPGRGGAEEAEEGALGAEAWGARFDESISRCGAVEGEGGRNRACPHAQGFLEIHKL